MLDLRYFNFCPQQQTTLLGMVCRDCQYLGGNEGDYRCDYEVEAESGGFLIRDIINHLLGCLEAGQKNISKAELLDLLDD